MAEDCRMMVDQLRFGNHEISYGVSKIITFRNALNAVWTMEVLFYRPFGLRLSLPHYLRLKRAWVKLSCKSLRKRVFVEAKITMRSRESSAIRKEEVIKNFFEKGDSSVETVTIFENVYLEEIPAISVTGELKIYVNPENYFYYKHGLNYLPAESQLRTTRLQIINDLSEDLLGALSQEHTSDVVLRCESDTVKAHKVVLSSRSKKFSEMLQNLEENEPNEVDIKDMSSTTLKCLLEFIYSGKITISNYQNAFNLVAAADLYDLPGLRKLSLHHLQSTVSHANALEVLIFADEYDANLKKKALEYICKEFEHIKETVEWCTLRTVQPQLANEVLLNIIEFVNSEKIKK